MKKGLFFLFFKFLYRTFRRADVHGKSGRHRSDLHLPDGYNPIGRKFYPKDRLFPIIGWTIQFSQSPNCLIVDFFPDRFRFNFISRLFDHSQKKSHMLLTDKNAFGRFLNGDKIIFPFPPVMHRKRRQPIRFHGYGCRLGDNIFIYCFNPGFRGGS